MPLVRTETGGNEVTQPKLLIQHRRSGFLYEAVSCWIPRPAHCGVRRVIVADPVVRHQIIPPMFVVNPKLWNWDIEQGSDEETAILFWTAHRLKFLEQMEASRGTRTSIF